MRSTDKFFLVLDHLRCVMPPGTHTGEATLLHTALKIDMAELSGIAVAEFWLEWRSVARNKELAKTTSPAT